ncbi:MAG: hypothetical protein FWF53_06805 [Candidatus Azobacteroides sp.]|nr:hypothetical protein [Candidatus Azobacteroides sp.]
MKVYEALSVYKPMIEGFQKLNVGIDYAKYLDLYNEFVRLKNEGHKITYIVAYLATEYEVSERTVYKIVNRFEKEI